MAAVLSSSRRALHALHRRFLLHPSPTPAAARHALPTTTRTPIAAHSPTFSFSSSSSSRFSTAARSDARLRHGVLLPQRLMGGVRSVASGGGSKLAPLGQGVKGLGQAAKSAPVGLQVEAFWRPNYVVLFGAGAIVCVALWSTFVDLSEGMAKYGFLALATAIVAFALLRTKGFKVRRPFWWINTSIHVEVDGYAYDRSGLTINPDKVYRLAMTKLNTSAAILEVMGAPLTGTGVRAYAMSGGGPTLKDFRFAFGRKRCFLIFPIKGSERRGLVSVDVKNKKGQYDMKLLAVDILMASGPDQRLFLVGDEQDYKADGGLLSELRDPCIKDMAAQEENERKEREEAEQEAAEKH